MQGKRVEVKAKDLNVQSLQDTMSYKGKQESVQDQITVGTGVSGSASYSKSKMNADYASVKQQAGIFAGDEGYDIDIANHSDLKAGLVTSTDKAEAEGKNRFSTGTLNAANLDNHANYKGSSVGVSAAGDYKGGWNGQRVDKEGKPTHSMSNVVGYGKDQDSQSSRTTSGINTQNLIIRDEQAQLEKTGKTAAQMKEEVKNDITTDSAESHSGKLENRFDKDKLQKELDYQVKAITEFQTITMATISEKVANHAESKRAEAEQAKAAGNTTKARELEQEAEKWETGGAYRQGVDAVTNAVGLALGGSPTAGIIAGAASPYINTEIKQATEGNTEANLIAHAIWGAVEAYTQGGKAGAGAAAAVTGEVGAKLISEQVFGKSPENLTEAEKRTVSELSQVAAGLAGGLSASSGSSLSTVQAVKTGQGVGKNAVENNYLSKQDWIDYKREIAACGDNQECIKGVKDEFSDVNRANSEALKAACRLGGSSEACSEHTKTAQEGLNYARENIPFDITSVWQASMMRTAKKESEMQPSKALIGSETIDMLEKLASNSQYKQVLENSQTEREKFKALVDTATLDVRTEKGNAYEFGAYHQYPNISSVSNYNYFGRELGLETIYPEFYILGGVGAKGIAKGVNALTSTSTKMTVGINGAVSAGAQYLIDGEINPGQVLLDMAEAGITKDFGYKKFAAWNMGTGFIEGYYKEGNAEDGLTSALSKWGASSFGYGVGKTVESGLNPYFNPYRRGFETVPAGLNGAITRYKPENVIPTGAGNLIDSSFGRGIDYIKENSEHFNKKGDK